MPQIENIAPVFIAKTKSFWLGIVPAARTLVDVVSGAESDGSAEPIAGAVVAIFGPFTSIDAERMHAFMLAVASLCPLLVAHQRRGLLRPYTSSPSKEAAAKSGGA